LQQNAYNNFHDTLSYVAALPWDIGNTNLLKLQQRQLINHSV